MSAQLAYQSGIAWSWWYWVSLSRNIRALKATRFGQCVMVVSQVTLSRKTRIALELAYKWKNDEAVSVSWIHASTAPRIEKGYLDIAKEVNIVGWDSRDPRFDKTLLVKSWLEGNASGRWILILDNADDIDLLYGDRIP